MKCLQLTAKRVNTKPTDKWDSDVVKTYDQDDANQATLYPGELPLVMSALRSARDTAAPLEARVLDRVIAAIERAK